MFTAEGPRYYAKAYAYNRRYAKPGPYQTKLSPEQEQRFRAWVKARHVPFDVHAKIVDYDMRGYWKATGGRAWKPGSHFPGTYKTPYDTTFSAESKYAKPGCPLVWRGETLVNRQTGEVVFAVPKRKLHEAVDVPVHVEKRGEKWAIVDPDGSVKGTSDSEEKAKASARIRNKKYREKQRMQEASARRDADEFTRARAALTVLDKKERELDGVEEARATTIHWDPTSHPRDRLGKFVNVLAKLGGAVHEIRLPGGVTVEKKLGRYHVTRSYPGPHPVYADVAHTRTATIARTFSKQAAAEHALKAAVLKAERERPASVTTRRFRVFDPAHALAKASPGRRKPR